jgi:hypothetical protein
MLLRWSRGASGHPPAGHGGEGRAQATAACSGEKFWWRACLISEVSDSLLPPAGRGGGERKFEVALLLRSSAPKEGGIGDATLFGSSILHGACRHPTDAAPRTDSSSYTADELRIADQVVLIFLSLGCIRRRQLRSSLMSLPRFSEEDPSVLSSVLLPRYLQLNLIPRWSLPSRLLAEPLALRLARLLAAFEVHSCRFTSSVFSTDP